MIKFNWIQENINKTVLMQAVVSFVFGTMGALLVEVWINHYQSSIATINVTALQDSFIKETIKQNMNKEVMANRVALFSQQLNKSINQIVKEKQVTLIISEAVIGGSKDYTQIVAESVKKGMSQ